MAWPDFSARSTEPEWMDTLAVSPADFAACLADLEQVNILTRAWAPTRGFLERATAGWPAGSELRLVDVGFGQGEMLRRIHRWATARGFVPLLTGVDLNSHCRAAALAATPAAMGIDFRVENIFDHSPAVSPHFVTSALFAHHLDAADLQHFVAWQEGAASHGWFVNDLHRHWFAWGGFWLLSRAAFWHRFVQHDGPLSVRRAFVSEDWQAVLSGAGVHAAEIAWHMPFRLCISRLKAQPAAAASAPSSAPASAPASGPA